MKATNRRATSKKIIRLFLTLILAFGMTFAACEGPQGPEGPRGEQGEQGQQGEQGPAGDEGNANVTLYIFDGYDFSSSSDPARREIDDVTETEMEESQWDVYLVHSLGWSYHLSGYGIGDNTMYFTAHRWEEEGDPPYVDFWIEAADGPGEEYTEIHIIRTAINNVNDQRSKAAGPNYSNYKEVVGYYHISDEETVRVSSQ